ncbi:unnamed protein product [Albugo candida]|uniref:Uncharacterized protein n=1 Tax=Albugo candida TaxID=65357 RepID=A0A024FXV6_9STRA|nr:unnamed protein product [Albugo candida]|eukprot:CCI11762.1 unnamed protein product [Albugo candida]
MVQLMRGLIARLDPLEECQNKMQGPLSGGKRPAEAFFALGLGRAPLMNIAAWVGSTPPARWND